MPEPLLGTAFTLVVHLDDLATPGTFLASPPLATGDVQVSKDGGTYTNLTTLPTVTPAATSAVQVDLSATEMTVTTSVDILFHDPDAAWGDLAVTLLPTITSVDGVATTLGVAGVGLSAVPDLTGVTTLLARLTAARAGYLDNVNNATLAGAVFPTDPADESLLIAATDAIMARLGVAGAGLTALGDSRVAHLDVDVSSRSTYAGGAVASVTADVGITQAGADKVWGSATRTLTSLGTFAADVWAAATRVLTAGTNIVLAKGTGLTGLNDLSAAQVNAEADTALADVGVTTTVTGRIDAAISSRSTQSSVDAIKARTDLLPDDPADESLLIAATDALGAAIAALNNLSTAQAQAATAAALSAYGAATAGQVSAGTATVVAFVATLNDLSRDDVHDEIADALSVDAYGEPGQGAPPAAASLAAKIGFLYKAWRNKKDGNGASERLWNGDGTVVDQIAATSAVGGVVTKGQVESGP